jgi:hypothetical protein
MSRRGLAWWGGVGIYDTKISEIEGGRKIINAGYTAKERRKNNTRRPAPVREWKHASSNMRTRMGRRFSSLHNA